MLGVLRSLGLRIGAVAVLMVVLMHYLLPRLVSALARSQELLLVFAIAEGVALAALGEWAGFSKEAGAFLTGFSPASAHYREAINARLAGIRDFLLLFFFVDLWAKLDLSMLGLITITLSTYMILYSQALYVRLAPWLGVFERRSPLRELAFAFRVEFQP